MTNFRNCPTITKKFSILLSAIQTVAVMNKMGISHQIYHLFPFHFRQGVVKLTMGASRLSTIHTRRLWSLSLLIKQRGYLMRHTNTIHEINLSPLSDLITPTSDTKPETESTAPLQVLKTY